MRMIWSGPMKRAATVIPALCAAGPAWLAEASSMIQGVRSPCSKASAAVLRTQLSVAMPQT